jgi:hypothetical protein
MQHKIESNVFSFLVSTIVLPKEIEFIEHVIITFGAYIYIYIYIYSKVAQTNLLRMFIDFSLTSLSLHM